MDQKPDAINNIEASTFINNSSSPKKFLTSLCKDDPNASDEFLEIEINKPADLHTDFGFNICGGSDKPPYIPGYRGIFVTFIKKDGLVDTDGRLRVGDRIISINGTELTNETHAEAVKLLKGTKGACKLVVEPNAESKFLSRNPRSSTSNSYLSQSGTSILSPESEDATMTQTTDDHQSIVSESNSMHQSTRNNPPESNPEYMHNTSFLTDLFYVAISGVVLYIGYRILFRPSPLYK